MKYLITSALPYVNGTKHLGNLVGSLLPSDVYARYLRTKGERVLYICATDEHGSPTEVAAKNEGITPQELCDRQFKIQQEMNKFYNLSFDYFGRSSSKNNIQLTQYIANKLQENGFIEERIIKQFFSIEDNMFLADRFIVGKCPFCGYENARGDQCEACTKVLDPTDLINPKSAISGSSNLELRETKHLFLLQSKLEKDLQKWIAAQTTWPKLVKSIAQKWLKEGLQDRCITRDLSWGVPVNKPGYENKVFYVWFDAPIAYISATKDWVDEDNQNRNLMDWWGADSDTKYVQFMGKDNIPFHTITFPATIMGAGSEFKQPDYIKGVNWLNYYDGKFSTSSKRGIFMNQAMDLYPADYWRYALMANIPEGDDSNFTWEAFAKSVNSELADAYGNFVQRVSVMNKKYFGDEIPDGGIEAETEKRLMVELEKLIKEYDDNMSALEFRKAVQTLYAIFSMANTYFSEKEPWKRAKEGDMSDVALTLRYSFNLERLCAILSSPFIPETSNKIYNALNLTQDLCKFPEQDIAKELTILKPKHPVSQPGILFNKILPEKITELKAMFGDESVKTVNRHGKELHI